MEDTRITLTHLNIRQSIAILLSKLILVDIIAAFVVITLYFVLVQGEQFGQGISRSTTVFLSVFTVLGIIKLALSIYVVLQWMNEYYEITPEAVIHKRGVIVKRTEKYNLDKVRALKVENTIVGEMFNYATVSLYDLRMNKYLDMYLIHNPDRYAKILRTLRPDLEFKTDRVEVPFLPKKDDEDEFKD